jgi:site-specific recombinase XerC
MCAQVRYRAFGRRARRSTDLVLRPTRAAGSGVASLREARHPLEPLVGAWASVILSRSNPTISHRQFDTRTSRLAVRWGTRQNPEGGHHGDFCCAPAHAQACLWLHADTRALQAYLGHRNIQHTVRYTDQRGSGIFGTTKRCRLRGIML